ncbi:type II toxin-antitoxin system RelE/ParE family toxin [Fretibacter rubidus]|uniref:type II toxin-antitoxin system RelE/ParE family toxin n=1 Tax=Fretibacter rubidus TaxID=570162 RepID=UPI00352AEA83
MTRITYAKSAAADLADIKIFYRDISDMTFQAVYDDITSCLNVLKEFPESGVVVKLSRRRIVTTKYRFIITYEYADDTVRVIGIYRFQNRK